MTATEALEVLLKSYKRYYNVKINDVVPPFTAEAAFHSHDEQYFLVKAARLSEADAHEYVFFATGQAMGLEDVRELDEAAWSEGLSRVTPHSNHRSSDIVLIILAEHMSQDAKDYVKSIKRYKSYRFTFRGWSNYSVIAMETSTGELSCNKRGKVLKKLFRNIK